MRHLVKVIRYWAPPALWMLFIFSLSSKHRITVTHTYIGDFVIFKLLHMIEYAILYFLLSRAFFSLKDNQLTVNKKMFYPFILSVLYAATDEFHQTFTPTREGTPRDILIDTLGIFLMYSYIKSHLKLLKKFV